VHGSIIYGLTARSGIVVNKPLTALAERLLEGSKLKVREELGELLVAGRLAELAVREGRVPLEVVVAERARDGVRDGRDGELLVGGGWLSVTARQSVAYIAGSSAICAQPTETLYPRLRINGSTSSYSRTAQTIKRARSRE